MGRLPHYLQGLGMFGIHPRWLLRICSTNSMLVLESDFHDLFFTCQVMPQGCDVILAKDVGSLRDFSGINPGRQKGSESKKYQGCTWISPGS